MRRSICRSVAVLPLVLVLFCSPAVWGWGNAGHEAVACVAWKLLDQPTKDKVWALLQQVPTRKSTDGTRIIPGFQEWSANLPAGLSDDEKRMWVFMRAATYPDSLKHTFLHDSDVVPNNASATANLGFTDLDSHGYWHFVNTAFGTATTAGSTPPAAPKTCASQAVHPVTELPATPGVNAETEIVLLSGKMAAGESTDLMVYDMMWLEHLVGDIHQPLHAAVRYIGGVGDLGGNCVVIKVPAALESHFKAGDPSATPPAELHAFWDDLPGEGDPMVATQTAVTYAGTLPAADATAAKVSDPQAWMTESFTMAKSDAYTSPIGNGLGVPAAFVITPAYYDKAAADAQQRIALAGARLADLLTKVLNGTPAITSGDKPSKPVRPRPAHKPATASGL